MKASTEKRPVLRFIVVALIFLVAGAEIGIALQLVGVIDLVGIELFLMFFFGGFLSRSARHKGRAGKARSVLLHPDAIAGYLLSHTAGPCGSLAGCAVSDWLCCCRDSCRLDDLI
jgi:hypothetical protein